MVVRRGQFSGMRGIAAVPTYVVMQPTTLCNLDCAYCYLPFRAADRTHAGRRSPRPSPRSVNRWARDRPLLGRLARRRAARAGREHLAACSRRSPAASSTTCRPTRTLIDDAWCEFFAEHEIRVSVSVDGPRERNGDRVTRAGRPAYDRIMRGIDALRRHEIPFSALCVVSDPRRAWPAELYDYFLDLGCDVLGINIEETRGRQHPRTTRTRPQAVRVLGRAGRPPGAGSADPPARDRVVPAVRRRRCSPVRRRPCCRASSTRSRRWPTTARCVLLSPELAGFTDPRYGDFTSGNVLDHTPCRDPRRCGHGARPGSPSS